MLRTGAYQGRVIVGGYIIYLAVDILKSGFGRMSVLVHLLPLDWDYTILLDFAFAEK